MSDVKRLLAEATPLPWDLWHVGTGLTENAPDQDLIVYAVNRLPAYLAAVEALESLIGALDYEPGSMLGGKIALAHSALARLRDEAPA